MLILCFIFLVKAKVRKLSRSSYPISQALFDFTFDMFGNITKNMDNNENMAFSPISLFSVFSMLVEGKIFVISKESFCIE